MAMFSLEKWSYELGVENAEDNCLVNDVGRVCRSDRSLQRADMAE